MQDLQFLSRVYHAVLTGFVEDGRAPHYTALVASLRLSPDDARQAQRDLVAVIGGPHWLMPGTDYVASFSPFSNVPTQYLISVEGEQKWYGQ
ncbi:MAG: hypothetical protein HY002_04520 [Candidatus Rokubacteria bacterium]|nr:hypothetical protein [Candidatus Rokubacteria bacterium]